MMTLGTRMGAFYADQQYDNNMSRTLEKPWVRESCGLWTGNMYTKYARNFDVTEIYFTIKINREKSHRVDNALSEVAIA